MRCCALLLDKKAEIENAIEAWKERAKLKEETLARWRTCWSVSRDMRKRSPRRRRTCIELDGIREGRQLLDTTDPLPAPLRRLRQLLTQEVTAAHQQLGRAVRGALDGLGGE